MTNNTKPFDYAQGDENIALRAAQDDGKKVNNAGEAEKNAGNEANR